jgi:hypothetical protein
MVITNIEQITSVWLTQVLRQAYLLVSGEVTAVQTEHLHGT